MPTASEVLADVVGAVATVLSADELVIDALFGEGTYEDYEYWIIGGQVVITLGGSLVAVVSKKALKEAGQQGLEIVIKGGPGKPGKPEFVREIVKGEKVDDLIGELVERTWTSDGKEHAIISLEDGTRHIVSGSGAGIKVGEIGGLKRVIVHTHPEPSPPSPEDFDMLKKLGLQSSFIYNMFGEGLTKFSRKTPKK